MSVAERVLDAIELLTSNSVAKAGYDRTIQAQILSCEDETIGKYRCRHQDAVFYAYSTNIDVSYSKGTSVYILVPANDMSKDKTILGSVDQMGINYLSEGGGDPYFYNIGGNCISQSEDFLYLDSGIKRYLYTLYDAENSNNVINFDSDALNVYIKQTNYLKLGMKVQTRIPQQNRYQGSYGIIYELQFDNGQAGTSTSTYMLSSNDVQGEPFNLPSPIEVFNYFPINGQNFKRIKSVHIFNQDFYNSTQEGHPDPQTEKLDKGDIIFSDLQFQAVGMLTPEQLQGTLMNISTRAVSVSAATLIAEVFSNGNKIKSNLSYYWGKRNITITPDSPEYNELLGRGWQCLNTSNTVGDTGLREWRPEGNEFTVDLSTLGSRSTMFKAAAAYNNNIISDQEEVINLNAVEIKIITEDRDGNNKTIFYNDDDSVVLTCSVNEETDSQKLSEYTFKWAREINNNTLALLEETTEENKDFDNNVSQFKALQQGRDNGTISKKASEEEYSSLSNQIKKKTFESFMVNKNKIYGVQAYSFENICTYYCTVSKNGQYIGTAQISLFKKVGEIAEGAYTLVMNNGTVAFQYDEQGRAPTQDKINPQIIQALGFTLYDSNGSAISANTIVNSNGGKVVWQIPTINTLLIDKQNPKSEQKDDYRTYQKLENFLYDIAYTYDVSKVNNQIKLTVTYDGLTLTAQTNFVFTKQGNPGTNGTEYVVNIIPAFPVITQVGNDTSNFYWNDETNFKVRSATYIDDLLDVKLYNGAEEITGFTKKWQILKNKYIGSKTDISRFQEKDGHIRLIEGADLANDLDKAYANILKCTITYNEHNYYSTVPITTAWVTSDDYRINLKENTGCRFVVYDTDGTRPKYNKTPFTMVCSKWLGYPTDNPTTYAWEDELLGDNAVKYQFGAVGSYKNTNSTDTTQTPANLLSAIARKENDGLQDNQCNYKIAQTYDGLCVNAAATCIAKNKSNIQICRVNIPVHFLLNKYGFANLNDWDGNSIQINEDGGYILSPQMGAGKKNTNNAFTGVLMGHIEYSNKKREGLLGFNEGEETFFVNSENGSVILGKNRGGQIIIDPSSQQALLYSNNYWKNYNNDGLPSSYNAGNEKHQGMLIDLSTPQIKFGSGKFSVDSNGKLTATEVNVSGKIAASEGTIGGWIINENTITGENTTLNKNGSIYTNGQSDFNGSGNGTHISSSGIRLGSNFKVTNTGAVTANSINITGGSISIKDGNTENFKVTNKGVLTATGANITGTITASQGKIGNFSITNGSLTYNSTAASSSIPGAEISTSGISFSSPHGETMGAYGYKTSLVANGLKFYINHSGSWDDFSNLTIMDDGKGNPYIYLPGFFNVGGDFRANGELYAGPKLVYHEGNLTKDVITNAINLKFITTSVTLEPGPNSGASGTWSIPISGTVLGLTEFNTSNGDVYISTINQNGVHVTNKHLSESRRITVTAKWAVMVTQ